MLSQSFHRRDSGDEILQIEWLEIRHINEILVFEFLLSESVHISRRAIKVFYHIDFVVVGEKLSAFVGAVAKEPYFMIRLIFRE